MLEPESFQLEGVYAATLGAALMYALVWASDRIKRRAATADQNRTTDESATGASNYCESEATLSTEIRALRFPVGFRQRDLALISADLMKKAIDSRAIEELVSKFDQNLAEHKSVLAETSGLMASTTIGIINEWVPERMRPACRKAAVAACEVAYPQSGGPSQSQDALEAFEYFGRNRFDFDSAEVAFLTQIGWEFEPVEQTQKALKAFREELVRHFLRSIENYGSDDRSRPRTWHGPLDEITDDMIDAIINICDVTIAPDNMPPEWHAERIAFAATYLSAKASLQAFPHSGNWSTFRAAIENRMEAIVPSNYNRSTPRRPEDAGLLVSYGSPYSEVLDELEALCDRYLRTDGEKTELVGKELLSGIVGEHPNLPELINNFGVVVEFCEESVVPQIRHI
jgi:hypothetical protein